MKRILSVVLFIALGVATLEAQVDPVWSYTYDLTKTPTLNGFTQKLDGNPAVTIVTGGSPALRGIQVDSTLGDAIYLISSVPNLIQANGATAEFIVNVGGNANGDFGMQVSFQGRAILISIFPNKVVLTNGSQSSLWAEVATTSNASDITWRVTVDDTANVRVYRNTVPVLGPTFVPAINTGETPNFMFWCESKAVCTIKGVKFYLGGPVAP